MVRNVTCVCVVLLAAEVALGQSCPEGEWRQWTLAEGGNGHWYRLTSVASKFDAAEAEAVACGGHLVTINDLDENQWVLDNFVTTERWIGFYQDRNDPTYSEPRGAWKWVGHPDLCRWETTYPDHNPCYTNWWDFSPNNNGDEDWAEILSGSGGFTPGTWNDRGIASVDLLGIIERETPIPAVSTWGLVILGILVLTGGSFLIARRRAVRA